MDAILRDPELAGGLALLIGGILAALIRGIFTGGKVETVTDLVDSLSKQVDRLEKEAAESEQRHKAEIAQIRAEFKERERLYEATIRGYELQLAEQRGRIVGLEQQVNGYQESSEKRIRELVEVNTELANLKHLIDALQRSANQHGKTIEELNTELQKAKAENEKLQQEIFIRVDEVRVPLIEKLQKAENENMELRRQVFDLTELLNKHGISEISEALKQTDILSETPSHEPQPAEATLTVEPTENPPSGAESVEVSNATQVQSRQA